MSDAASTNKPPTQNRNQLIDICRGVALMVIMVDHIELSCKCKALMWLTLIQFGLSDGLDVFIFISGYVFAIVHERIQATQGFAASLRRAIARAGVLLLSNWLLYCVVLLITIGFSSTYTAQRMNLQYALQLPWRSLLEVALLKYQPVGFAILPLYAVILFIAPFQVWLARKHWTYLAMSSLGLYLIAAAFPNLSLTTLRGTWAFQPLGWQLVFAGGILGKFTAAGARIQLHPRIWLSATLVLFVVLTFGKAQIQTWLAVQFVGINMVDKEIPGLLRLAHFIVLACLVCSFAQLLSQQNWKKSIAGVMSMIGRNALPVFLWGILLRYVSVIVLEIATFEVILTVEIFGFLTSLAVALAIENRKRTRQAGAVGLTL